MASIDDQLFSTFRRALRAQLPTGNFTVDQVSGWDSLTHIKLIMELEIAFGIAIGPDEISPLFSDFDTVRDFVASALEDE